MNKFLIGITAAAVAGAGAAIAQNAPVARPAMPNHPHMAEPMTRASVQAHLQGMFAKLDANRDGFITKAEADAGKDHRRANASQRRQGVGGHGRDQAFERIDANKDGTITRDEFAAAPRRQGRMMRHARMGGLAGKMFDRADANKDGRVSLAEAQQAAFAHFDRVDLNRDGTGTPAERQQARQLRRPQPRS